MVTRVKAAFDPDRDITIDRTSPVPLYFQVAQQLEAAIADGRFPSGSRLPNEVELAAQLAFSRPTMRRAMDYLVDRGLIVRQRGVGTRVVSPKVRRSLNLTSLYDDMAAGGQRPRTRVLGNDIVEASSEVAKALGLRPGDPVVHLVRLRSARDQPIAHMTNYLPADRVTITTENLETTGLYDILRRSGVQLHSATQLIGARTATAADARMLRERKGAALLTMQRTAYDDHGVCVEYGDHSYAASRYTFEMSMLAT
jgi:GntR family transcriptional regulator